MKYLNGLVIISILYLSITLQAETSTKSTIQASSTANNSSLPQFPKSKPLDDNLENSFLEMNSEKKKNKKKKIKIQKVGKYTIKTLENFELIDEPKKLKKYVKYSQCSKKSGYLSFVLKRPRGKKRVITVYPIFVTLNQFTLSLFKSFNAGSLFKIISLDKIQRVSSQYGKTFCFDVILNEIRAKDLQSGPLSLCASNINEMKEWIRAILEFKECKIKGSRADSSIPHQGRTLVDFNKINDILKQKGVISSPNQLAYDTTDTVIKNTPYRQRQKKVIKKEVNSILHSMQMLNIAKNVMRRKILDKWKRKTDLTKGAFHTEELLQNIIVKKNIAEKEQYASMMRRLNTKRTRKMLRKLRTKIEKMSMNELKEYKDSVTTEIKLEKKKAGKEASKMVETIISQQRLINPRECTIKKLKNFRDSRYVNDKCLHWYGDFLGKTCILRENFCHMCCNYHIGANYPGKRFTCNTKCERRINHNRIKKGKKSRAKPKKLGKLTKKNRKQKKSTKSRKNGKKTVNQQKKNKN